MTIATAWAALAKQENAAYRKKWGTGLQQQKREQPKPTRKGTRKGTYNPERLALIKELIEEGFRTVDIAREAGISESSVRYWKAKYFQK
jgi:DNA-binding NarL/FixJ family response regulator